MSFHNRYFSSALSIAAIALIVSCSGEKSSKGGTPNAAAEKQTANVDTPVDEAPATASPLPSPPVVKPTTTNTFNECDKFADTNIVADMYKSNEGDFRGKYKEKTLTNLVYGSPDKTFCMANLDIPMRPFTEGFPGYPNLQDWFVLDTRFTLNVPADGSYTFLIDSDDGSMVTVNGQLIIDVDGLRNGNLHVIAEKAIELKKGPTQIRVQYFQGPGADMALQLKWKKPGNAAAEVIPLKYIDPPK